VLAGLLLLPLLVCLVDGTLFERTAFAFVIASLTALIAGLALQLAFRFREERFQLPEAFCSVAAAWLVFSLLGALPFLLTGAIPRFVDAYFETMSGATTTGASVLSDPALLGRPLLLWRSLLHLIGGLGIVALSVAILPALGAGGNFLFQAEAVGPEKDKLVPRISTMSKLLWAVYIGLTIATVSGYVIAGMAPCATASRRWGRAVSPHARIPSPATRLRSSGSRSCSCTWRARTSCCCSRLCAAGRPRSGGTRNGAPTRRCCSWSRPSASSSGTVLRASRLGGNRSCAARSSVSSRWRRPPASAPWTTIAGPPCCTSCSCS
jgi:hypothetical protein